MALHLVFFSMWSTWSFNRLPHAKMVTRWLTVVSFRLLVHLLIKLSNTPSMQNKTEYKIHIFLKSSRTLFCLWNWHISHFVVTNILYHNPRVFKKSLKRFSNQNLGVWVMATLMPFRKGWKLKFNWELQLSNWVCDCKFSNGALPFLWLPASFI